MEGAPSARMRVRRHPERGVYQPEVIEAILDEAYICHVGFVADGQPMVLPTVHARLGRKLYLHGAAANAMFTACAESSICVAATLLDGLVLARSVYDHSMNYRSVVVVGIAHDVTDSEEKRTALRVLVDHVVPGRADDAREPKEREMRATRVLRLDLDEASAKVRSGPPSDAEADVALPVWSGEVPLALVPSAPQPAPNLAPSIPLPDYLSPDRLLRRASRGGSRREA